MARHTHVLRLLLGGGSESLLPDFVLAFAFFTALIYSVLAKRFDRQRPAIAVSAALGTALSVGLIWWELRSGVSVRDLGPLAAGIVVLVLGAVMYRAVSQIGGGWAGVGIAVGTSLLLGKVVGINVPVDRELIQAIVAVALIVGLVALLLHGRRASPRFSTTARATVRHDMRDLKQARLVSDLMGHRLDALRQESRGLDQRPELAQDIVMQIRRILPGQGWLTERMARLREKAHRVRSGHVANLKKTRRLFAKLPASSKKAAAGQMAEAYGAAADLDRRMERLDKAVVESEKRIRELTRRAAKHAAKLDHRKLHDELKEAERLQKRNSKIFKAIDATEVRLASITQFAAKKEDEVTTG